MCVYFCSGGQLATDIEVCQYRHMPKSLVVLEQAGTGACCAPGVQVHLPSQQPGQELCCAPLAVGPLTPMQAEQVAPLLKALADPVRLRLMSLVASSQGGEACVCDLTDAFDLSQPTISHHLKVLREAGLIDSERRGTWVYYRVVPAALERMAALLSVPAG